MIGGAIATAAHLARHAGRPERVFGAPIGGLERRVEEEAAARLSRRRRRAASDSRAAPAAGAEQRRRAALMARGRDSGPMIAAACASPRPGPALHASATMSAPPDVHVKRPHDRPLHGQFLLA